VYNGAATLNALVGRLVEVLDGLEREHELILVNDGSRDDSWREMVSLTASSDRIAALDLTRNFGQHNALLAGVRQARHEIVLTLDDDLQNPPEEIPALLAKIDEGYDVVYGTPIERRQTFWRNVGARMTRFALVRATGNHSVRDVSSFRAFRTSLRDAFAAFDGPFVSIDVLLSWGTTRFAGVPVRHNPRAAGESNYRLSMLAGHAVDLLTGFSAWPLRLASLTGFAFTLLGVVLLSYVLTRYFVNGGSVPGFPFLASAIALFSGAQLFALGIIGEYLARMHFRSMQKPAFVVRERRGRALEDGGHA
jgi:undecaprenyl-phosphate 4-deoxy-4-formamido-L-arabinose transferase